MEHVFYRLDALRKCYFPPSADDMPTGALLSHSVSAKWWEYDHNGPPIGKSTGINSDFVADRNRKCHPQWRSGVLTANMPSILKTFDVPVYG